MILIKNSISKSSNAKWLQFKEKYNLTSIQLSQFIDYFELLVKYNEIYNLTAITDLDSVITDHFEDSLILCSAINCSKINSIVDVGTGAGFPGLPLKIMNPDFFLILIEVTRKKINFLRTVIEDLGLTDVIVYENDWRTFLRKTSYSIDNVLARASLQPEELIRMFNPGCFYKNAYLVYWASIRWKYTKKSGQFFKNEYYYSLGSKQRRLIFFHL